MVFVIHWHESAMDLRVLPIPIPPPTSLSTRFLWVFPVYQVWALVSCIQPGLVICFTLDNIHVSNAILKLNSEGILNVFSPFFFFISAFCASFSSSSSTLLTWSSKVTNPSSLLSLKILFLLLHFWFPHKISLSYTFSCFLVSVFLFLWFSEFVSKESYIMILYWEH